MALSVEEQQRVDVIVDFVSLHKMKIVAAVAVTVVTLGSWFSYEYVRESVIADVSEAMFDLQNAIEADDEEQVAVLFERIVSIGEPDYVENAGLLAASYRFWKGDKEMAADTYRTVISFSSDPAMAGLAGLRLAQVLLDLGRNEEARDALDNTYLPRSLSLGILYDEIYGDVLLALGDLEEAGKRYRKVLDNMPPTHNRDQYGKIIAMKLALTTQKSVELEENASDA